MTLQPLIHHRRSIRLRDYDYASNGAYFVTICTLGRKCLFGQVIGEEMQKNEAGSQLWAAWQDLPMRFPGIHVDEFIAMPNHVHGIIVILDVGAGLGPPGTPEKGGASPAPTLGNILCAFKSITAIQINRLLCRTGCPLWQRNYYERVIRNEGEMNNIRNYISTNPYKWADDEENPAGVKAGANLDSPWRT